MIIILFIYLLFQKKLLPNKIAKIVAKLYFYPSLPLGFIKRIWIKMNYMDLIDKKNNIWCSAVLFEKHIPILKNKNIKYVINMCDEYPGPIEAYYDNQIIQLRLPTIDHEEPSLEYMFLAIKCINKAIQDKDGVLIHCKAGHGRAGAISFCHLLTQQSNLKDPNILIKVQQQLLAIRRTRKTLYKQKNIQLFYQKLLLSEI